MEVVVESVADQQAIDDIKINEGSDKPSLAGEVVSDHKSNGVPECVAVIPDSSQENKACTNTSSIEESALTVDAVNAPEIVSTSEDDPSSRENCTEEVSAAVVPAETTETCEVSESTEDMAIIPESECALNVEANTKKCPLNNVQMEEIVEYEIIEPTNDNVRFETEILVETNDNDVNEVEIQDTKADNESPNNILSELENQNIELSEVLRSSDVTENVENNNCPIRQEVFNKEELLDILEGNDVQPAGDQVADIWHNKNTIEAQLAIEQLSRLKNNRKLRQSSVKEPSESTKKKNEKKVAVQKESMDKEENIVNALVKDWDDDEVTDDAPPKAKEASKSEQGNENLEIKEENTVDSSTGDNQVPELNKNTDDGQPQRRLGRVIKKKVIFDPDNPDTFTKSKILKNKEAENDKEHHQPKKAKLEQVPIRAKSKSPVSKMQWKKPQPKNCKQNKRLSEVDRLLMDEGAVNMIYQLTPEAPKGKKNMKTKAEFIKKLQSSTPEGKEMKFRERKKESLKGEEGEAKRILSGKQRSSLNSSVKSPSVSEDFETHSADDSIIYRRHSSSSYSSSCMSPRRLSDVDAAQSANNSSQKSKEHIDASCGEAEPEADVFQPDSSINSEIINKDDCLSIKKKLNSKLSLALNKRKRESSKTDKIIKKKVFRTDEAQEKGDLDNLKCLSLTFNQRVAEICIRKTGSKYNIEVLNQIERALSYIDTRKDISVTLLTSECGALCSDLDLTPLLNDDIDKRSHSAAHLAESVRSMVAAASQHDKVLCCGVWAECWGVGLALVALSDVALAAERAAFSLRGAALPAPALPALAAHAGLSRRLITDMLLLGHQLTATEAQQHGLVSRVLWPSGVADQVRAIAKDISKRSPQGLLMKKKLLKLGKATFLSQLESEAALMANYWTSEEGQQAVRADAEAV